MKERWKKRCERKNGEQNRLRKYGRGTMGKENEE